MHAQLSRRIVLPDRWHYTNEVIPVSLLGGKAQSRREYRARALVSETAAPASTIYVVDDEPRLTNLYAVILAAAGYVVQAFNDRVEALAALKGERNKPELLVTDFSGHAMSADRFMQRCVIAHPFLRILMASGLEQDATCVSVRPDRFLRKPFTAEKFLEEVKATLCA